MPAGLPTSTAPLERALVAALTTDVTGASKPRALTTAHLFTLAKPGDTLGPGPRSDEIYGGSAASAGRGRPQVGIRPIRVEPIDPTLMMTDRVRYDATIVIVTWYYAHDVNTTAWRQAVDAIAEDMRVLPAALCYPSALYTDPDGDRTGLDSGCLDWSRWSHEVSRGPRRDDPKVLQVTYTFRASLEMTAPGAAVGSAP